MNHSQKFSLGTLIVFAALIAYALLADTAKDKGTWVWLIVALAALGLALPAVKYPGYRRLLGFLIRGGFDGVSELVSSPNLERSLDCQPVPRALHYNGLSEANNTCLFPRCSTNGRKICTFTTST